MKAVGLFSCLVLGLFGCLPPSSGGGGGKTASARDGGASGSMESPGPSGPGDGPSMTTKTQVCRQACSRLQECEILGDDSEECIEDCVRNEDNIEFAVCIGRTACEALSNCVPMEDAEDQTGAESEASEFEGGA